MRSPRRCDLALAAALLGAGPAASAPPGPPSTVCVVPAVLADLAEGDFNKALAESEACRESPAYARLKGQAFHGLFQADSAVFYLRQDASRGADDVVNTALAEALLWKKEVKEAVKLLGAVKDKKTPAYFKAMAARYEAEKKFPKALKMYDNAIVLEKVSFGTRFRKAMVLSWMKELDASIALYTALIEASGTPPGFKSRCIVRRAEVMAWNMDMDRAADELTALLQREKGNGEARLQLGQVMEWQGRFKEAKDQYKDVLVRNPEDAEAKRRLEALIWVK